MTISTALLFPLVLGLALPLQGYGRSHSLTAPLDTSGHRPNQLWRHYTVI